MTSPKQQPTRDGCSPNGFQQFQFDNIRTEQQMSNVVKRQSNCRICAEEVEKLNCLITIHIPGTLNHKADSLSGLCWRGHYSINELIIHYLTIQLQFIPQLDLFANRTNVRCLRFFSILQDRLTEGQRVALIQRVNCPGWFAKDVYNHLATVYNTCTSIHFNVCRVVMKPKIGSCQSSKSNLLGTVLSTFDSESIRYLMYIWEIARTGATVRNDTITVAYCHNCFQMKRA
ncbi:MAG: hypothetical protein EZS28_009176 [Streblomastix strix]|uniref:Uncharacterized protein n=1 Tax=Streblomastix strix TaxID=222440 RepID=A0A5J4WJU3_9EUKA|nr:MAG: hypothetical protein EZS28_009176 [Streblomastix strix]